MQLHIYAYTNIFNYKKINHLNKHKRNVLKCLTTRALFKNRINTKQAKIYLTHILTVNNFTNINYLVIFLKQL